MTNEMIERVAKTLHTHATGGTDWEMTNPEPWWRAARAAIEAMREPTEAMVAESEIGWREALGTLYCKNVPAKQDAAKQMYYAMIDAALK